MERRGNLFEDPAGILPPYSWHTNHLEENDQPKRRNVETTASTAGTGLVRQQGAQSPMSLDWSGTILNLAQVQVMWEWFQACETRTVFLTDFAGDRYEVIITSLSTPRRRVSMNPRDPENAPLWIWSLRIEMQIVRVLEGSLAGVWA